MISAKWPVVLAFIWMPLSGAHAEIYKWVDQAGETHYSGQEPGSDVQFQSISVNKSPPAATRESVSDRLEASNKSRDEAKKAADEAAIVASDTAKKQRSCEQAKIRTISLQNPRINKVDEDGTRTRMPEEWRQEELAKSTSAVSKYCG
ncbi:MAG: DUF4124 domain-containing protein [Gammaproteobacteria bacterium]